MKPIWLLSLFITFWSTNSIGQKKDLDTKIQNYIGISAAFEFNSRTQAKLLDSIENILMRIDKNLAFQYNKEELHQIIDSVKDESYDAMSLLKSKQEPERKVPFKIIVTTYIVKFMNACDNEFLLLINNTNSNDPNTIPDVISKVKSTLSLLNSIKKDCYKSDELLRKKYKISVTQDSNNKTSETRPTHNKTFI